MAKIGIIGTAGRDKSQPMTKQLWHAMLKDAMNRIPHDAHLVSGGAAWADHLAVSLFIMGYVEALTIHLPAPFNQRFKGEYGTSGGTANYYHDRFSQIIGVDTLHQLHIATKMDNVYGGFEQVAPGYDAMFKRNLKVAAESEVLYAYTFGAGNQPADGGTLDTWNKCKGEKTHISLINL